MDLSAGLLAIVALLGLVVFALAMLAVALRVGPRRGTWNQPAAALAPPGRLLFVGMYIMALLHVAAGIVAWLMVDGAGFGIVVVLALTGAFYVLCAHGFALATATVARRDQRRVARAGGRDA